MAVYWCQGSCLPCFGVRVSVSHFCWNLKAKSTTMHLFYNAFEINNFFNQCMYHILIFLLCSTSSYRISKKLKINISQPHDLISQIRLVPDSWTMSQILVSLRSCISSRSVFAIFCLVIMKLRLHPVRHIWSAICLLDSCNLRAASTELVP
jgi:hypothetical protein